MALPPEPSPLLPPRLARGLKWTARVTLWTIAGLLLLAAVYSTIGSFPYRDRPETGFVGVFAVRPGSSFFATEFGWAVILLPAGAAILLTLFSAGLVTRRRREAMSVLGHVATAIDLGLPLATYLRLAAAGEGPALRRRLGRLSTDLESGRPLGTALRAATPDLPPRVIDRVAAAEKSFALGNALGALLRQERGQLSRVDPFRPNVVYVCIVGGVALLVFTMINVFVTPKFLQVFHDFGAQLPTLTLLVFNGLATGPALVLLIGIGLVLLFLLVRIVRDVFVLRRRRHALLRPVVDRVIWALPVLGRLTRARHYAVTCEVLDEALRAGRPLPEAIETATLPSLNVVLRGRLRRWRTAVEIGDSPAAAARGAGLPGLLCDLLAAARHDTADAVAFAGQAYAGTATRLGVALAAVAPVLLTAAMAACVFVVALALFEPYVKLIDVTAMKVYP